MDVEGFELPILSKLVDSGVACKIHMMFMELHGNPWMYPVYIEPNVTIPNKRVAVQYFKGLNTKLRNAGCQQFMLRDSEKFLHDGKPYPTPPPAG